MDASLARAIATAALAFGVALRGRPRARAACAVGALAAIGAASLARCLEAAARGRPDAPFEATIEATVERIDRQPERLAVELVDVVAVRSAPSARVASRVRLRAPIEPGAPRPPLASALPGDRLRLRARLRPLETRSNPGRSDPAHALARRGIGATGSLVHPDLVVRLPEAEGVRPLRALHRMRAAAQVRLQGEGQGGALLAALALGERGGLDATTIDAFRQLGLTHLLAVSGLHLLLASALAHRLASPVVRWLPGVRDARRAALGVAVCAASGYALLAGFGVPVRRALVMLGALAISFGARRPVRRAAPLSLALLGIVLAEPAALFDAGAQMSFLATAALVLAWRPAPVSARAWRGVVDSLDTSVLATAATAPIAAAVIGLLSPWGLVANLVAVPWTGSVLLPLALTAATLAAAAPAGGFTDAAMHVAGVLAEGSLAMLLRLASQAPPAWETRPPAWAVGAALLTALAMLRIRSRTARLVLTSCSLALLVVAPPPRIRPPPPRMVVLDVGQGDATLVQGRRASVLVDAGTALPGGIDLGASVVVPALRALGVRGLDLAVATHADLDHRGGLASVLGRIRVDRLWLPPGALTDPAFESLRAVARVRGTVLEERGAEDPAARIGDLVIETPWPPRDPGAVRSRNDASLVLRVSVAGRRMLLTGDIEAATEAALLARGAALSADVLKLAHHGSRTSSTPEFLAALAGAVAIASAPRFGRFGMPHRETIERTREAGYSLWWTGRDGAVLVGLEPRLHVYGWRRR